jgi:DNA-binding response OmpR family regulator
MPENRKILIIDDDEFLLDMYAMKFKEESFEVDIAPGAREAIEKIKNGFLPEITLLDIVMPGMDGFEFLEAVKNSNLLQNSKIIILTNLGQQKDIDKGIALGASDYIM